MTIKTLDTAILEAKRFLAKAEEAKRWVHQVKCNREPGKKQRHYEVWDGVASAACKRSSLDLTRALARMRRPQ